MFLRLFSIGMNFLISLWIYFFLTNRIISILKDSGIKSFLVIFLFLFLMCAAAICSLLFNNKTYIYIQIGILVVFSAGELFRFLVNTHYTTSGPVYRISYYDNLIKPVTTRNIKFYEYDVHLDAWKGKPLTIAHISDLHIVNEEDVVYYDMISQKLSKYSIDYLFLSGDYISGSESFQFLESILHRLCGAHKTYAVLGNHDYWVDAGKTGDIIRGQNIHLLENDYTRITAGSHSFILSGYNRPWGTYDYSTHSFPETENSMHLCLSHNPDNIFRLSGQNINIVFSGHYHAGEIRLPYFGALVVPSLYSRWFTHGHFLVKNTHLFVSAGTGSSLFRTRIYCNPDIFIIRINGG